MHRLSTVLFVGLVLGIGTSALAGPLATDPAALPAWRGTTAFSDGILNVNVDYAVFAPGAYGVGDPSGGTRYVYAYQGFNVSTTRPFSALTVGLQNAANGFDPGFDTGRPLTGGVMPFFQDIDASASSFRSFFNAAGGPFTKVPPGGYSQVLRFTSPFPPQFFSASVIDEGQQVQRTLPSPIPEPATVALFALLGTAFLRRRQSAN